MQIYCRISSDEAKSGGNYAHFGVTGFDSRQPMLMVDDSDKTVADLTTDGCNMGVKSLSRYLNQYKAADEKSKDLAKKLIKVESDLSESMREFGK